MFHFRKNKLEINQVSDNFKAENKSVWKRAFNLFHLDSDLRVQIQELESELELQQQQISNLRTRLDKESKVNDVLLIKLADEQRARWANFGFTLYIHCR